MELLGLNLLFIALSLPLITLPAALCGMTSILMKWVRDETVFFWSDFWREFKADFFSRFLAWLLLTLIPISLSLYAEWFFVRGGGIVLAVILGAVSLVIQSYLFPILVMVALPTKTAVRNAVFMSFVEWRYSLRILLFSGLAYAVCFIFTLYAIPAVLLGLVVLCQLTVCVWVNDPISRRLILPREPLE